jgi:hypothetical protein
MIIHHTETVYPEAESICFIDYLYVIILAKNILPAGSPIIF